MGTVLLIMQTSELHNSINLSRPIIIRSPLILKRSYSLNPKPEISLLSSQDLYSRSPPPKKKKKVKSLQPINPKP